MLRNVLEASATTLCVASSQLFGDSESISITFTIFGMSLISFPLRFRTTLGIWPQAKFGCRSAGCLFTKQQESLGADRPSRSYRVADRWRPPINGGRDTLRRVPNFRRLPSISSKRQPTLPRLPAELFPAISAHQ